MSIPIFRPTIRRREMHSVLSCLVTDEIGPSTLTEELVSTVAGELKRAGGRALREYPRAVDLCIRALGLERGDRVVISPLAPRLYMQVFDERGLIPVFADVDEQSGCMDAHQTASRVDEGAKAVFLHVPLGRVPDMTALAGLGIPLVEDMGESLGSHDGERPVGSAGTYLIFPMEPHGIVTVGGGTLLLAADKASLKALSRAGSSLSDECFLSDLNASLGLAQWRERERALSSRDSIAKAYRQALTKGSHRSLPNPQEGRAVSFSFPVVLKTGMKEVRDYARKKGVETVPAFSGCILEQVPEAAEHCPRAQALHMSVLLFPLYPSLGGKNVHHIMKVLSTLP